MRQGSIALLSMWVSVIHDPTNPAGAPPEISGADADVAGANETIALAMPLLSVGVASCGPPTAFGRIVRYVQGVAERLGAAECDVTV